MGTERNRVLIGAILLAIVFLASAWSITVWSDKPRLEKKSEHHFARPDQAIDGSDAVPGSISNNKNVEASVKESSKKYYRVMTSKTAKRPGKAKKEKKAKKVKTNKKAEKSKKAGKKKKEKKSKDVKKPRKSKKLKKSNKGKKPKKTKKSKKLKKSKKVRKVTRKNKLKKSRKSTKTKKNMFRNINGKRLPSTCYCRAEQPGRGNCYYYTDNHLGYCKSRYCARRWVCVGYKKSGNICILRKVTSRIVPYDAYTCATERVNSYMYVPYAY